MKELSESFNTSLYERKKNILKIFHTNFLVIDFLGQFYGLCQREPYLPSKSVKKQMKKKQVYGPVCNV